MENKEQFSGKLKDAIRGSYGASSFEWEVAYWERFIMSLIEDKNEEIKLKDKARLYWFTEYQNAISCIEKLKSNHQMNNEKIATLESLMNQAELPATRVKYDVIKFNKWLFDKKFVPNSSFLWFKCDIPPEDIRFFELGELYDIFSSGISIEEYDAQKEKRLSAFSQIIKNDKV